MTVIRMEMLIKFPWSLRQTLTRSSKRLPKWRSIQSIRLSKEDDTGVVLQILFDSNTPQQPPNDQPDGPHCPDDFTIEQKKDPEIRDIFEYAESGKLPADDVKARRLVLEGALFAVTDGVL
jgi:hypothetical protein